jgi:hypothetical protein
MTVHQKRFELRLGKPSLSTSLSSPAATRRIFKIWFRAENQLGEKWRAEGQICPIFVEAENF